MILIIKLVLFILKNFSLQFDLMPLLIFWNVDWNILTFLVSLSTSFPIFCSLMIPIKLAENIVKPFSKEYDFFRLNKVLDEKLKVIRFLLRGDE